MDYTYELVPGGYFIFGGVSGAHTRILQLGDPSKPAVNGVLQPYADEYREAAAKAAIADLQALEQPPAA